MNVGAKGERGVSMPEPARHLPNRAAPGTSRKPLACPFWRSARSSAARPAMRSSISSAISMVTGSMSSHARSADPLREGGRPGVGGRPPGRDPRGWPDLNRVSHLSRSPGSSCRAGIAGKSDCRGFDHCRGNQSFARTAKASAGAKPRQRRSFAGPCRHDCPGNPKAPA
jgi:hypothetical protein